MANRPRLLSFSLAASLALVLGLASVAAAAPGHRTVQILDNCDPASFNEALGDGACVRDGGFTFGKLIEHLLRKGDVASWRFAPEQLKLAAGGTVTAINRGGEAHTFSPVAEFGGGCIEDINALLGLTPVAECADFPVTFLATLVPPGASIQTDALAAGTNHFMCLIHPWQRTTVEAR